VKPPADVDVPAAFCTTAFVVCTVWYVVFNAD
jgi:hypothetical protein